MYRKDILDNPIFIFILFIGVSLANILLSVHFIPLMFAGVMFIAFIKTLQNRYYYSLFLVVLTFFVIENTQGFKTFSLLLIALFIYIFVKSYLEQLLSSSDIVKSLYIVVFYLCLILVYSFFNEFDMNLLTNIIINIIIDVIIIGLFI